MPGGIHSPLPGRRPRPRVTRAPARCIVRARRPSAVPVDGREHSREGDHPHDCITPPSPTTCASTGSPSRSATDACSPTSGSRWARASGSASSARTARASPPCSGCSPVIGGCRASASTGDERMPHPLASVRHRTPPPAGPSRPASPTCCRAPPSPDASRVRAARAPPPGAAVHARRTRRRRCSRRRSPTCARSSASSMPPRSRSPAAAERASVPPRRTPAPRHPQPGTPPRSTRPNAPRCGRPTPAATSCSTGSASPGSDSIGASRSSRAASAAGSRSPRCCSRRPTRCCSTSRRTTSTTTRQRSSRVGCAPGAGRSSSRAMIATFLDRAATGLLDLDPGRAGALALASRGSGARAERGRAQAPGADGAREAELAASGGTVFGGSFSEFLAVKADERDALAAPVRGGAAGAEAAAARGRRRRAPGRARPARRPTTTSSSSTSSAGTSRRRSRAGCATPRDGSPTLERAQVRRPPAPLAFAGIPSGSHALDEASGVLLQLADVAVDGPARPRRASHRAVDAAARDRARTGRASRRSSACSRAGSAPIAASCTGVDGLRVSLLEQDVRFADPDASPRALYERVLGERRAEQVPLAGLGLLAPRDLDRPLGRLSVGQQRRLALALVIARPPHVFLLDEPTNHLSLALATDLEEALGAYPGRGRDREPRPVAAAPVGGGDARARRAGRRAGRDGGPRPMRLDGAAGDSGCR